MSEKLLLGAHTSTTGGIEKALIEGAAIGATTIQLFTSNQRQWRSRPLTDEILTRWKETLATTEIEKIMSHGSYLINLASFNDEIIEKSLIAFREEIERCLELELAFLNFHPGSALNIPLEDCLDRICASLLSMRDLFEKKSSLRLLLETTAGQGTTIGRKFEELSYIIEKVKNAIPIGVCIDTCHIFVAGYDITSPADIDLMLKNFDKTVGLEHLYAFHLNDSLKGCGSHVDRHRPLGEGAIGIECFKTLMRDERTRHLPKYLETPDGPPLWTKEIAFLRGC